MVKQINIEVVYMIDSSDSSDAKQTAKKPLPLLCMPVSKKMSASRKDSFVLSQTQARQRPSLLKRYLNELKNRSLNFSGWMLVLYAIAVASTIQLSHNITVRLATPPVTSSEIETTPSTKLYYVASFGRSLIHIALYLFVGWFSDIKIGRKGAVRLSLWINWAGVLLEMISLCVQFGTSSYAAINAAKYAVSFIALVFMLLGSAMFFVNVIAYGLDQLADHSSSHIRAFVHWLVWGLFVGFSAGYGNAYNSNLQLCIGLGVFVASSLAVSLDSLLNRYYVPSGVLVENPYKLVLRVLRYAMKHKNTNRRRSAFTYWEQETPNRINLAKQKYGGPFPDESVENVKTFLRIIAICIAVFGFYIPFFVFYGRIVVDQFEGSTESLNGYGSYVLWSACDKIVIISVAFYELLLLPLFPKLEYFFLNPLRWLGISYILLFISLLATFTLSIAGEIVTTYKVNCTTETEKFKISFLYFTVPLFIYGLTDMISIISSLEFISSQSPSNMSGMLTGLYWFVRGMYTEIGRVINISFSFINNGPGGLSCNFWNILTQLLVCIVGFFIYVKVARWYQNRVRNEEFDRVIVEEAFNRRLERREDESVISEGGSETDSLHDYYLKGYVIETMPLFQQN